MINAIDRALQALDVIDRYSYGTDEFSRVTIRNQVDILSGILGSLEEGNK